MWGEPTTRRLSCVWPCPPWLRSRPWLRCSPRPPAREGAAPPISEIWTFRASDPTTGATWTMTVPSTSTYATSEWIEEAPVVIDDSGNVTVGPLPKQSTVHGDNALTNGATAGLQSAEAIQ